MKKITSFVLLLGAAVMMISSCSDTLTPDLKRYAGVDKYAKDSIYSALGILRSIQNVAERTVILGDAKGDLFTTGTYTTDSVNAIANFENPADGSSALLNVADFYHVINSCNFYLANVDTTVTQNNVKIMQREWAQVQSMRAWAYIQLVRYYGEVPFVTTPVSNTDEAERQQHSAPKANASTLISLLKENGLSRALELQNQFGFPFYGNLAYGSDNNFGSQMLFFPVQLVLADACLMNNDYENAANYYYRYIIDAFAKNPFAENNTYKASVGDMRGIYYADSRNIRNGFTSYDNSTVVSAMTNYYGKVLNQIQNIYGFKTTVTMGSTSVEANEQMQQLLPSNQYVSLNRAQTLVKFNQENEVITRNMVNVDARLNVYAPRIQFMNGDINYVANKYVIARDINYGPNGVDQPVSFDDFTKQYFIPMYRSPLIMLRFAEAINRLGFPELAFGLIKDGLYTENIPTYNTADRVFDTRITTLYYDTVQANEKDTVIEVRDTLNCTYIYARGLDNWRSTSVDSTDIIFINADNDTLFAGQPMYNTTAERDRWITLYGDEPGFSKVIFEQLPDTLVENLRDFIYITEPTAASGGMYYLGRDEVIRMQSYPFFDFSSPIWSDNNLTDNTTVQYGIHARGCGQISGRCDTIFTYARQVAEHIAQDYARQNNLSYAEQQAYARTLYNGDTLYVTDKALIQNAVENIIVDELALEDCFEGHRFTDLVRIAGHKTAAGMNGTEWLAWKIARRNSRFTDNASEVDAALKAKVLDQNNWYFKLPE